MGERAFGVIHHVRYAGPRESLESLGLQKVAEVGWGGELM